MRLPSWIRQHLAAVRALAVLTVITGIIYPLAVFGVAQIPGLKDKADGSMLKVNGKTVGSELIGQSFTDKDGNALKQYFQSRPSSTIEGPVQKDVNPDSTAYNPTGTSAGNLGPEDTVDTLPDPKLVAAGEEDENAKTSLLTTVCTNSKTIGELEGVDGSRPFCTPGGVGAVLSLFGPRDSQGKVSKPTRVVSLNEEQGVVKTPFVSEYKGVKVELAKFGEDYAAGQVVPIKGDAPTKPAVPADAVTASGSGLDPHISTAYADIQIKRIAAARHISPAQVEKLVKAATSGRDLGFMGEPRVNVVKLNAQLDARYPFQS
ncbi:potassium-transporting ATPase subunit C [Actinomadura barringtoniae]|uniref:Potassium-transporting ATPase KdpC subunit n=1 Tax=Actinomadura barringtoniae TaxID=1427535 RepID=A0A939PSI3_9ACTN|nr:potassium-transporting ATPase subunit C [Actinomadura barringtoniae]MBO2453961.1 potassium-transporting ATPase subunit C [Actinomadura barringtoniae]